MEQDKGVRKNLAYVDSVTKIAKAATKAFQVMYNKKSQALFTKETVERYTREEIVDRDTGEERI